MEKQKRRNKTTDAYITKNGAWVRQMMGICYKQFKERKKSKKPVMWGAIAHVVKNEIGKGRQVTEERVKRIFFRFETYKIMH